jgi:L-asparaginase
MVSLGGTITMTQSAAGGITPTLSAADLVRSVPGIERVAELETTSPMRLPGPSLPLDGLIELAALVDDRLASGLDGAVVIQGTDTIEETAWLLDLLVRSDKPVVVTGAMRGPQAAGADGPANLLAATIVAACPNSVGLGTLVVMNDQIHAARFVQKTHTVLTSSFSSPLAGPLGFLAEGRAHFLLRVSRTEPVLLPTSAGAGAGGNRGNPGNAGEAGDVPVALLRMALGEDGRMLQALPELGYRGAVIEGMGAGHVPASVAPMIGALVQQMPVLLSSRVPSGPTFRGTYGYAGAEIDLIERGVIPGGALGGLKARILLGLLLRCGLERSALESRVQAYCEGSA